MSTTHLQRLGDALALLCGGVRPPDELITSWISDPDSITLQEFVLAHCALDWAQGIVAIYAAFVLAETPEETAGDETKPQHEEATMARGWRKTAAGAAYLAAHKAHEDARKALIAATRAAFPIGLQVESQQRHGVIVDGEVTAACEYSDPGAVVVRNVRTGKTHRAYPTHFHFETRTPE